MRSFDHQRGESVSTDGAALYFESVGDKRGSPLVLLHGGMGNLADFSEFAAGLSSTWVIAIDSRGHGKSTLGRRPLTYQQLAQDVRSVLEHLNVDCFSVLGFSDGGIVGYRLAIEDGSRVHKLVAIGAPNTLPPSTAAILEKVTASNWNEKYPETRIAYDKLNPEPDFEAFLRESKRMWLDTSATGYPADQVKTITCPTLLIRGDDDPLFSLSEAAVLRQQIKNSHLLNVAWAGHMAFNDQTEICSLAVNQFLGA